MGLDGRFLLYVKGFRGKYFRFFFLPWHNTIHNCKFDTKRRKLQERQSVDPYGNKKNKREDERTARIIRFLIKIFFHG